MLSFFYGSCYGNSTEFNSVCNHPSGWQNRKTKKWTTLSPVTNLSKLWQHLRNNLAIGYAFSLKKKQKTKNTCISARCVITVRLHATYWEITQAWHKPFTFDNFAIVLIPLVRMTVSFLLLLSLMLCMLFQTFFSLSFMAFHSGTFAILFPSSIMSSFFSQGGDPFKWRMRTARMGTKYSWLKKHTHENLQVRTSFLRFVVLFL